MAINIEYIKSGVCASSPWDLVVLIEHSTLDDFSSMKSISSVENSWHSRGCYVKLTLSWLQMSAAPLAATV